MYDHVTIDISVRHLNSVSSEANPFFKASVQVFIVVCLRAKRQNQEERIHLIVDQGRECVVHEPHSLPSSRKT